jgi:hypothetical protein
VERGARKGCEGKGIRCSGTDFIVRPAAVEGQSSLYWDCCGALCA